MVTVALVVAPLTLTWKKKKKERKKKELVPDMINVDKIIPRDYPCSMAYDDWLFYIWIWNARARMFYDSSQITSDNASSGVERCRRDVVRVICRRVAALQRQWRMVMVVASSFREERTSPFEISHC